MFPEMQKFYDGLLARRNDRFNAKELCNWAVECLFKTIYNYIYGQLLDPCCTRPHSPEDMTQETFLRFHKNLSLGKVAAVSNAQTMGDVCDYCLSLFEYLRGISRRVVLERCRSSKKDCINGSFPLTEEEAGIEQPGQSSDQTSERPDFPEILGRVLTPEERLVVRYIYFEDLRVSEIAIKLDVSESTVYRRLRDALRKLRSFFDESQGA